MKRWRCPKCGRRIPARNAVHACRPAVPVGTHLRGKSAEVRKIFARVRAAVRRIGPAHLDSTKTRIAFAGETIFLELAPQQSGWRGCLMLGRPARHALVERVVSLSPRIHYHYFKLTEARQVDAGFRRLLGEAYKFGQREHLKQPLEKGRFPPTLPAIPPRRDAGGTPRRRKTGNGEPKGSPRLARARGTLRLRFPRLRSGQAGQAPRGARPLWRCPKCGKPFVNRNQWHSCVRLPVEHHFRGKDPRLRRTFNTLVKALRSVAPARDQGNEPVRVTVSKTRIEFVGRMRFGGVQVTQHALRAGLLLPRVVRDPRILRVIPYGPRCYGHSFWLRRPGDIDRRLRGWLAEAYRVGQQEHLQ